MTTYSVVQDEGHQKLLHIILRDVKVFGDEGYSDACVWLDNVEHHLRANVLQQIFYVVANEGVIINSAPAAIHVHPFGCAETQLVMKCH